MRRRWRSSASRWGRRIRGQRPRRAGRSCPAPRGHGGRRIGGRAVVVAGRTGEASLARGWRRPARVWHDPPRMPKLPVPVLASPLIRRVAWHVRRVGGQLDRRFFLSLAEGIVIFVAITAVPITLLEKPWTLESTFEFVQLGDRHGPGPGRPRLRHLARRPGDQLVADPLRGRHARHDHRGARRPRHRFPAQGGPGVGCVGLPGPHRRLRLECHRARPDRRAARRRLQDQGRRR